MQANATIEWLHDSNLLTIVARRAISRGEEVCHCYILGDEDAMAGGLHARRYALKAHSVERYGGFICRCSRCVAEEAEEAKAAKA